MNKPEKTPKKEFHRVDRGSSWNFEQPIPRAAYRRIGVPTDRSPVLGFRLLEVLDEQD